MVESKYVIDKGRIKVVHIATPQVKFILKDGIYHVQQGDTLCPIKLRDMDLRFDFVYDDNYGSVFGYVHTPGGAVMYIGFKPNGNISLIELQREITPNEIVYLPSNHPFIECLQTTVPLTELI